VPLTIVGFAIVSTDDRIADAAGAMPQALKNDADWTRFQAELDASAVTVLGRLGHEAHGNPRGRLRMVVSTSVATLERRADGWWWNPVGLPWEEAISRVLPDGGRVAVPGGQGVFDLFRVIGYDEFHLTRAQDVRLPDGRGLFAAVDAGRAAADVLVRDGLVPGETVPVDPAASIDLTVWRRPGRGS
jgi:hypothetical protein